MPLRHKFITDPDPTEILQIMALYQMADWWGKEDGERGDLVRRLVLGSHCFLVVVEDDTIVGMGRAISDGVNDAYIQDVTVIPRLRHQDIGTRIVEAIVQRLHQDGLRWIGLIAADHSHEFYKKLGFMVMPFSTPMLLKEVAKS
jgi:ribosomal protein S18 acetylase RimI-like enzyme